MKGFGDLYKSDKGKNKKTKFSLEEIVNLAIQFHLRGNLQEASKYYKQVISQGCNDYQVFSNYAGILYSNKQLDEAEILLKKAIKINPNFAGAHSNLGNILKDLGKLKEAELSTRKAIEIDPNFADAHSNLGNILSVLGILKEAELSYRKAIALNPNLGNTYLNLGNILKDLGKLKEAELSYRKAIKINPDSAIAHSNLGNILSVLGILKEAELSTRKAIEIQPDFADAYYNLGNILSDLGRLKEAESSYHKAIEIKPDFADAYNNLGNILSDLGKLKEAESSYHKAIEIKPDFASAYYCLSNLKTSNKNKIWRNKLFSKNLISKTSKKDKVDIYFARANILHKEKNYEDSSKFLKLANELKLILHPSNSDALINKSKELLVESCKKTRKGKTPTNFPQSIFIVGMPRSGSTLLESILSMSNDVYDLGETNILEEAFLECKKSEQNINFSNSYNEKLKNKTKLNITTNKNLYNYQYVGIIAKEIPNAKIIHCFRHPLDNILSIYKAHFSKGNGYSSSLIDCAKTFLNHEEIMCEYKNRFRSKIYDFNYDSLVSNPNQEIKSLISWLGWKWEDKYLSPHLNPRSVTTASNVQVRSPINTKSLGGWKNYKEMLRTAMEIITQKDKYKHLKY